MLQELQQMGVSNVLTFDAHDPRVQNAVPVMGFDNLMPTYQVLKKLFKDFPDLSTDKKDFMIVSPDEGAMLPCSVWTWACSTSAAIIPAS